MLSETYLTVISGYPENEIPPELNKFLGLLKTMLTKIASLQPTYRYLRGIDSLQTVSEISQDDTVLVFLFPPLAGSGQFTTTLTGIMDVLLRSTDNAKGQIILFSDGSLANESKLAPEYIHELKHRYDLNLVTGGNNRLTGQENMFDCLLDIAYSIKQHREKKDNAGKNKEKPSVFLADTTPDAEFYRTLLKNELEVMGFHVITPGNLQEKNISSGEMLQTQISECFLSLHMIGRTSGKQLPDGNRSMVEFQLEAAGQHAIERKSGTTGQLKRMIWIMPHGRKIDPRQENLINHIKQESHLFAQSELLEIPFESFKTYVQKYITDITSAGTKTPISEKAASDLFVIYEHKAVETVRPVLEWLHRGKYEFEVPRFEGTPEMIMGHYKKIMSNCRSILIIHAERNDIWLRTKINDVLKAPGYGRNKPFHSCLILTKSSLNINPGEPFQVFNSSDFMLNTDLEEKLNSTLHHA